MTSIRMLAVILSWGVPNPTGPPSTDAYLGVIERIEGDALGNESRPNEYHVWARVAFRRDAHGDWVPATRDAKNHEELAAAPGQLPARIKWRACRDGRSLGTVVSKRRRYRLHDDRGTQALSSPPPFAENARFDKRFTLMMGGDRAIRPFVISTLSDGCRIGSAVRPADASIVKHLAEAGVAKASQLEGEKIQLIKSRGWQVGAWTVVEVDEEINGGFGPRVIIAQGDDIRLSVNMARVVDWVSADGDDTPDVILWTDGQNESAYLLIYGSFAKQVEFAW